MDTYTCKQSAWSGLAPCADLYIASTKKSLFGEHTVLSLQNAGD